MSIRTGQVPRAARASRQDAINHGKRFFQDENTGREHEAGKHTRSKRFISGNHTQTYRRMHTQAHAHATNVHTGACTRKTRACTRAQACTRKYAHEQTPKHARKQAPDSTQDSTAARALRLVHQVHQPHPFLKHGRGEGNRSVTKHKTGRGSWSRPGQRLRRHTLFRVA